MRNLRKALGKSQEQFANEVLRLDGFREGRWQKDVEGGQELPLTASDLDRIAEALRHPGLPWELLEPIPQWRPPPEAVLLYAARATREHERLALVAMAGAGKSFLARRLALTGQALREDPALINRYPELQDKYFAHRVFVHLGRHPDPAAAWARLYRGVGLPAPGGGAGDARAIRDHLSRQNKRALVVVDDVWGSNPLRGVFERLPRRGVVHVVYTTRNMNLVNDLLGGGPETPGRRVAVGPLPRSYSVDLLRLYLGKMLVGELPNPGGFSLDGNQLCELAARLDDHPLSLIVAAGVIRCSPDQGGMFKAINERRTDGDKAILGATARVDEDEINLIGYPQVRDILGLSYTTLTEAGQAAYRALGSFAAGEIRSNDLYSVVGAEPLDVVKELCDHNLLTFEAKDGKVAYRLHDLIRAHALEIRRGEQHGTRDA